VCVHFHLRFILGDIRVHHAGVVRGCDWLCPLQTNGVGNLKPSDSNLRKEFDTPERRTGRACTLFTTENPTPLHVPQAKIKIPTPIYLDCDRRYRDHLDAGGKARRGLEGVLEQGDGGKGKEQGGIIGRGGSKTWRVFLCLIASSSHVDDHRLFSTPNQ